ncbi:hypothetical protein ALC53_08384 [Atta colombica]|uniref:Uncharacterized protein n=1 Tax=Atta colombica TaxID=520822 RepID=A0A195B923_9HYME|nr:hypothetical protein ALC53_08384 [Atta colombica]
MGGKGPPTCLVNTRHRARFSYKLYTDRASEVACGYLDARRQHKGPIYAARRTDFCQEARRLTPLPDSPFPLLSFSLSLSFYFPLLAQSDGSRRRAVKHALIRSGIHVMPACALTFICEGSQDGVVRDGEGVAGLEEEEEEEEKEVEDEGTLERWEMGEEVEGRGGRASVGRATAIGRGKTRKIVGHPSITALPPRTGLAPFFDIPFSPIFALRTSVFTFLSSDLSLFFLFSSVKRALPSARTGMRAGVGATTSCSFRFENARNSWQHFPIIHVLISLRFEYLIE